jgi:hypothetical protein
MNPEDTPEYVRDFLEKMNADIKSTMLNNLELWTENAPPHLKGDIHQVLGSACVSVFASLLASQVFCGTGHNYEDSRHILIRLMKAQLDYIQTDFVAGGHSHVHTEH